MTPASNRDRAAWRRAVAVTALVAAMASQGMRAQEDEDARRHGIFIDSVEVNLINLEVFVSRGGEPVTDLVVGDFEVLDDGRPVEVSHFHRVDGGRRAVEGTPVGEGEEVTQGVGRREPATVIILVDQLLISPTSRKRVFARLSENLDRFTECGARMMVVSKTRDVVIEQTFTSSRDHVEKALERLSTVATPDYGSEIETVVELWDILPEAVESRQSGPGQPAPLLTTSQIDAQTTFQDARILTQRIHHDVSSSLAVLRRFLDSLAGLPGRKAIIYVADRLPVRPAALLWDIWWEKFGTEHGARLGVTAAGPTEFDTSRELEELISDANADRVSFYPVGSDRGPDLSTAASRGLAQLARISARRTESEADNGLFWLSVRTGGRAAVGTDPSDEFFDDLLDDLGTYYSLAYPSPHGGDARTHRVEIRVRRPDVEVRHPIEYRDKSADQRMADRTLSALTLGVEANDLGVRVRLGKAKRKSKGHFSVPLEIHVPLANLVLLPGVTTHQGKLSIQLMVRDDKGRLSEPVMIRIPIEVAHGNMAWALSQTVDYRTEMEVRGGQQTIAVGVHDDLGAVGSAVAVEVDIGSTR